jgi:hypothetical protein
MADRITAGDCGTDGQSGGLHSQGSHKANRGVEGSMRGRCHFSSKPSPLTPIGLLDPTGARAYLRRDPLERPRGLAAELRTS